MTNTFRQLLMAGGAACAIIAALPGSAVASPTYSMLVQTANQGGNSFDASLGAVGFNSGSAISANFNYTGNLNFNVGPSFFTNPAASSGYVGAGTLGAPANANFTTLASFLASSGSAAGYTYGSFYTIGLGTLAAGTILTITHDDGVSVYQGANRIGTTTSGPNSEITESVKITATGATTLYYGRQNGAPSVLNVAVPEPASIALFGAGLMGLAAVRRRRQTKNGLPVAA